VGSDGEMADEHTKPPSSRLTEWAPMGIALWLILSMRSNTEEWLYVAAAVGVLASIAVGRTSGKVEEFPLRPRLWKFAKGWLVVIIFAALGLLHGKWQPMVFFALVGVLSSVLFWLGCKSNR
jgi:uncharacterized membrane protein YecN with MAPEG domain